MANQTQAVVVEFGFGGTMNEAAPKPTISEVNRSTASKRRCGKGRRRPARQRRPKARPAAPALRRGRRPTVRQRDGCGRPRRPRKTARTASGSTSIPAPDCCCRRAGAPWKVRLSDLDTGNILFETRIEGGRVNTLQALLRALAASRSSGRAKRCSPRLRRAGKEVLVQFPVGTLGDTMGWFPYAVKFQAPHRCRLTCAMVRR